MLERRRPDVTLISCDISEKFHERTKEEIIAKFLKPAGGTVRATRLGYFEIAWGTYFLTKVAKKYLHTFWSISKNVALEIRAATATFG